MGLECQTGIGACARAGHLVCDAGGCATTCDTSPGDPVAEVCGNGTDDDCDGAVDEDCADTTCADDDLGAFAGVVEGTTVGAGADMAGFCGGLNGPDLAYTWRAPADGRWTVSLEGSSYDTLLYALGACGEDALACSDDSPDLGTTASKIEFDAIGGRTYLIVVDGHGAQQGEFVLSIFGDTELGGCRNGVDDDADGAVDCDDTECAMEAVCFEFACNDGLDNDADQLIDCADLDCDADAACDHLPADPVDVAPEPDPAVPAPLIESVEFLFTGTDPIQRGVVPGTIDPVRVAPMRGSVVDPAGDPISGVAITVLRAPEYGKTRTRDDGVFDLAVNGGGAVTVEYRRDGFIPVQRTLAQTDWGQFATLPEVVMTPYDVEVTTIRVGDDASSEQVHRASTVVDEDGERAATLVFPRNFTATMTLPDGSVVPINDLDVRATEFTVGPSPAAGLP